MMTSLPIIVILIIFQIYTTTKSSFVNKYVMDVKTIELCPDNDKAESPITNLKYVKIDRTRRTLSYDITYVNPLGENVGAALTVYKWSETAGWKVMPFLPFQPNMCGTYLRYFRGIWINFSKAMGVKEPDKCPIPPGSYNVRNFTMDFSSMPMPLWDGRFKVINAAKRVDNGRLVQCIIYIIEIHQLVQ